MQIPTIPMLAERSQQAALQTGPHQATDGASSSSAASVPESAAGPLLGGRNAAETRPRGPAADQLPEQGVGAETFKAPPRKQGVAAPAPGTGTGLRTTWAHAPRGSPPWL